MTVDLFAGLPVSHYERALTWYEGLLGSEPTFLPNATEAVWELAEHRYLYIEELPDRAGLRRSPGRVTSVSRRGGSRSLS